jgi:mannose-6-phosphate isomerase-like protein (cupin superfamily)
MTPPDARSHWLVHPADGAAAMAAAGKAFGIVMGHGSMTVEYYAPKGVDPQKPHIQDELYIIASGSGTFFKAGERRPFGVGDVIFVEAGLEHRFEDFTDDFATWVVFYGPKGGEAPGTPAR